MPVEVLLAEDNEGDARLIKEIVSRCSVAVRITVAEDGEKALALLADPQFKPDLIITDMNMPKVAGPELLKRSNANGIPVVVFSSSTNPTDKAEALKLGARECVEKPIDLDEYTEVLWKMIWKWTQRPNQSLEASDSETAAAILSDPILNGAVRNETPSN
jgi:CheY-like chemotaxis protein